MTHTHTAAEVDVRPENSPLKTVVGQTAHFLVTIDSVTSVPWKSVDWYKIGGMLSISMYTMHAPMSML